MNTKKEEEESSSLLLDMINGGFMAVFQHHVLLCMTPDAVIQLLWTCKGMYKHWRRFIRHYARLQVLECICCHDLIEEFKWAPDMLRNLLWLWADYPVALPDHKIPLESSVSSSDYDSDSSADFSSSVCDQWCDHQLFDSEQSLMFHKDESLLYSSRNFICVEERRYNDKTGDWQIRLADWECDACNNDRMDTFHVDAVQIYPLPKKTNEPPKKKQRLHV